MVKDYHAVTLRVTIQHVSESKASCINILIIRYQHFMKNGGLPLQVTVKTAIERQLIMNSLTLFSAFVEGIAAFFWSINTLLQISRACNNMNSD